MRKKIITTAVLVGAGMLLFTGIHIMGADHDNGEKHLFVWAGDQARTNPDFLAVINFDEHSHDYGRVITTVPLPGPGATGNEPHHVGLSADGRVLAAGGLLSVLKGQKEVFFSMSLIPEGRSFSLPPIRRCRPSQTSSILCQRAVSWSR